MRKRFTTAAVAAAAAGGFAVMPLAAASAAPAAPAHAGSIIGDIASPEQAGYQLTGGQFRDIHASVFLRNPAQYSSEVAGFGDSVQLWSSKYVIVLGVSGTTSASSYGPALAVYDTSTHAPVGGSAFGSNLPSGQTVRLSLYYNKTTGIVTATVLDGAGSAASSSFDAGLGVSFNQVRLGNETSAQDPWTAPPSFNHPAKTTLWSRWTKGGITTYKGGRYALSGWFTTGPIDMTGAGSVLEASPSALYDAGSAFTVSLQP